MLRVGWLLYGDASEATPRYRGFNVWPYLAKRGIECFEWRGEPCDLLVTQYRIEEERIGSVAGSIPIIFDTNDYVLKQDHPFSEEVRRNHSMASLVVCGTRRLADEWDAIAKNVVVIPDALDPEIFEQPAARTKRQGKPVIVWFGLPSTVQHLRIIDPVLEQLAPLYDHVRIISSEKRGNLTVWNEVRDLSFPWKVVLWERGNYLSEMAQADIGVAPLGDDLWSLCKGGHKVATMMAQALPVLASPIPSYAEIIDDGVTGFLCRNDQSWERVLCSLLWSDRLQRAIGLTAMRSPIIRIYRPEQVAMHWWQTIHDALGGPRDT